MFISLILNVAILYSRRINWVVEMRKKCEGVVKSDSDLYEPERFLNNWIYPLWEVGCPFLDRKSKTCVELRRNIVNRQS